jgi:hypothetical protein
VRRIKAVLIAAVASMVVAAPVGGITYGELDAGEHPYVGLIIFFHPSEPAWFSCSGTLLDADTFLTAAHCVFGIGTNGTDAGTSGGNDVWATFAPVDVLNGFPPRTSLTPEQLYPVRRDWLENNASFVRGVGHPHAGWDDVSFVNDVGIVELTEPVTMPTYGELADVGTIEALVATSGPNGALIETVGYGLQSVQPHPQDEDTRYKSTSRIVQINSDIVESGTVHTLNNPSAPGGTGGSCFGDSGGPLFVNNTNDIVAVVSFGFSLTCHGADYGWRVDTVDAHLFVSGFLGS